MSTKEKKQSNSGNNSTIKEGSTQSFESKSSEGSQSNLDYSNSGQVYFNVEKSPFAIVKYKGDYRIILGNDIVSEKKFASVEKARHFIKNEKWELIWAMCIWVISNAERIKSQSIFNKKQDK